MISHLHRCIKSLNKKDLALFLRFVTGADIMPEFEIVVAFITCPPLVPRSRTCIPQVELHETCGHYNELAEAFENVLKSPESFFFHMTYDLTTYLEVFSAIAIDNCDCLL